MTIVLYSDKNPFVGFNKLFLKVTDDASGNIVTNAIVTIMPLLNTGTTNYSAPFENPSGTSAADGKFSGAVVFIMPSSSGSWTIEVSITNLQNNSNTNVSFPVNVTEPLYPVVKQKTIQGTTYYVSMIEPSLPRVGINDMVIKVNRMESVTNYPNDSTYTFDMYPWMTSMGHGSPNNISPVYTGNGYYTGKVNFTMTGDWRINLIFNENATPVDSVAFDLEF
jgi:hypothetical protein